MNFAWGKALTKRGSVSNVKVMTHQKNNKRGFVIFAVLGFLILVTLIIIAGGLFVYKVDQDMLLKMQQKQLLQPTIFYSHIGHWKVGDTIPIEALREQLAKSLRSRTAQQSLFPGDFAFLEGAQCSAYLPEGHEIIEGDHCLRVVWDKGEHPLFRQPWVETLWIDSSNLIKGIFDGEPSQARSHFIVAPQVVAQYLGGEPILREEHGLPEIPVSCLNAIIAIEDAKFLEHRGVSPIGIMRAVFVNLVEGRKAQGGSTLTQQLIKNYFLTPEKTIKRKALEFVMALLIEHHLDKDLILETYLNVIYMGQQGPYQVRGYGAASRYYFQKSVSDLTLGQCSLLAAIVNSPGQYSPFKNPEKAMARRSVVLEKMEEQKLISSEEKKQAEGEPLPQNENIKLYTTLPYFLQAAVEQAKKSGISDLSGYRLFTTLDLRLQEAAQAAVVKSLESIESQNAVIKKVRETKKINLESALVSVDIETGGVRAVVGGRSYRTTQFNRILTSKRQVGSTFKPIVYLTALESDEEKFSPISELKDEPFTYSYGKQKWSPANYDHKFFGKVPMYFGLKESLNLATAQLAVDIGLNPIIETAKELGVQSDLPAVPSLSLGALELRPLELLQSYMTIARFGSYLDITFLDYITDPEGKIVWDGNDRPIDNKLSSTATQTLIGMLKQTSISGTARRITLSGFPKVVAGKTGTTNENRDTWFVGFTPDLLTVVWTGFDNNTSTGLTGASGSLPAWLAFMNEATRFDQVRDFPWTDEVELRKVSTSELKTQGFWSEKETQEPEEIDLIFKK
ncbi:MAG: hypothetical protein RJB66_647 [Pseudomonadota bacterium]